MSSLPTEASQFLKILNFLELSLRYQHLLGGRDNYLKEKLRLHYNCQEYASM